MMTKCMKNIKIFMLSIAMICGLFVLPMHYCSADALDVAGELAGMAVDAGVGALQDKDKTIVEDLKSQMESDTSHKQELSQYLEATRPEIADRQNSVKKYMTGMIWSQQHIPLIGGLISDGISEFFIWRYESALEDKADSDFLKKFVTLRERSIEANQGIMDIAAEMVADNITQADANSVTKYAHIKQLMGHYESAAEAMNEVFQVAEIEAQPTDDGNIFGLIEHPAVQQASVDKDEDADKKTQEDKKETKTADAVTQAQDAMKNFGIQDTVEATSFGHSSAGSLSITRSSNGNRRMVAIDNKNNQVAFVELTPKVYNFAVNNQGKSYTEPVILQVTILNDPHDSDADYGVWNGDNHTFGIYSAYSFDTAGNVVPGMLTSGAGLHPSHYQGYLYESKNVDLANLILTEMSTLHADADKRGVKI